MNTIRTMQNQPDPVRSGGAAVALEEENALLFTQLHVVQEELERVHHASGSQRAITDTRVVLEDGRFPEVAAENLRYRAILDAQKTVNRLEGQKTIAGGLGEILIKGTTSVTAFVAMPAHLLKVWRKEKKQIPPKELGGQSFSQVIAAYEKGGTTAVESLLARVSISSTTQANALTAVARSLMHTDPAKAAEFARLAYTFEPRPFRLKWLAFRMHEAGELVEAEAMLETLPPDTKFSESEIRQANRLRNEAKQVRLREALQSTGYAERRGKVEQQIGKLEQSHREQAELAAQRGQDIDALETAQIRLQQENSVLRAQQAEQAGTTAELRRVIESLKLEQSQLQLKNRELLVQVAEQVGVAAKLAQAVDLLQTATSQAEQEKEALRSLLAEQVELAAERGHAVNALEVAAAQAEQERLAQLAEQVELAAAQGRAVAELEAAVSQAEQEKLRLLAQHAEQIELAAERGRVVAELETAKSQAEQEKLRLLAQHAEQVELAAERGRVLAELEAAKSQAEQEKLTLLARLAEQVELAAERDRAVAALQAAKSQVEQERSALLVQHKEQITLATERGDAFEALKAAKAQLKQENSALLVKHVEQFELAAERGRAIEALKAAQAKQEEEKALLYAQYAEQSKLAEERAPQIKALQDQLQSRQAIESDLSTRQQGMQEELVKAEAQLELIKDMLFRGARL